jgi:hypothetical protein
MTEFKNASSENRFKILFTNHTDLNDSILTGQIPGFGYPPSITQYYGENTKIPGDNYDVEDMVITFKLDEDYTNYLSIFSWINNNFTYANDVDNMIFDSIDYIVLNAKYNPIFSFSMGYVFPIAVSEIGHTTQSGEAQELEFSATFVINTIQLNESI